MKQRRKLAAAGICLVSTLVALQFMGRHRRSSLPVMNSGGTQAEPGDPFALQAPEQVALEPPMSVQAFLEVFWGERWPKVRSSYETAGIELDIELGTTLKPWDEVSAEAVEQATRIFWRDFELLEGHIVGPGLDDLEFLRAWPSVSDDASEEELRELAELTPDINYQLTLLRDQFMAECGRCLEVVLEEGMERAPFLLQAERRPGDLTRIQVSVGGWQAVYRLSSSKNPELKRMIVEANELKAARMSAILAHARNKR